MADNLFPEAVVSPSSNKFGFAETTFGGDTVFVGASFLGIITGSEGSRTFTPLVAGAGAVDGGVQRMTLASDDPAVVALQIIDDAVKASASAVSKGMVIAGESADGNAQTVTVRSAETVTADDDGLVTRSILYGVDTGNGNQPIAINGDGNALLVSVSGTVPVSNSSLELIDDIIVQDDAAFTPGTTRVAMAGFTFDDSGTDSVNEGDGGAARMSGNRCQYVMIRDNAGNERGLNIDASGQLAFSNTTIAVTNAGTFAVQAAQSGTWNITNVSGTISLPTGAATAAKQPALGTAGTASSDVITIQGIASMTPLAVSDNSGSLTVDNNGTFAVQAVCTNAGTFVVQVDGNALTALQLLDDTVYTDDAAFTPGTSKVLGVGMQADEASIDSVDEGDIGCPRITLDRKQIVTVQPHTAGGLSVFRSLDLDETEEEVKATAGCLYKLRITNFATSLRYVKLYNLTAANTSVGSSTPIDTIPIPPASASSCIVLTESYGGVGLTFDTALSIAATTGLADADTGAPSANDLVVTAYYK